MKGSGFWPSYKVFSGYFTKNNVPYNKTYYQAMKRGEAVPECYVTALVALLKDKPAMKDFIASKSGDHKSIQSARAIITLITGPPEKRPVRISSRDWFMRGINGLVDLLFDLVWGELVRPRTLCRNERDVAKAVTMILTASGRYLADPACDISDQEAVKLVETRTNISHQKYLEKVIETWRIVPWSVVFAVVNGSRVACSRWLPLTESAYQKIRSGQISIDDCTTSDFPATSRKLFFDGMGEKTNHKYGDLVSKQQIRTIFVQIAHLSNTADKVQPLTILSLAGTPVYAERAKKFGLRPTGQIMSGTGLELYELDMRKAVLIPMIVAKLQERLSVSTEPWVVSQGCCEPSSILLA